jgi:hypothetical protein
MKKVVIDAQVYRTHRNHNLDHLRDSSPSFVGCYFVISIDHSVIDFGPEPSMGYYKIGNKLPFQTRYFKIVPAAEQKGCFFHFAQAFHLQLYWEGNTRRNCNCNCRMQEDGDLAKWRNFVKSPSSF